MEKVEVTKLIDNDYNKYFLMFDVKVDNELGDKIIVGSYSVSKDGIVTGEVDGLVILYHSNIVNMAKEIILRNGLQEIIGDNNKGEIFKENDYAISSNIAFNDDLSRWERANNFIKRENLEIRELKIEHDSTENQSNKIRTK